MACYRARDVYGCFEIRFVWIFFSLGLIAITSFRLMVGLDVLGGFCFGKMFIEISNWVRVKKCIYC